MLILLFVVPLIVFIISIIKFRDPFAVVTTLVSIFVMLAITALGANFAKDDIHRIAVVSKNDLVEFTDNVYVLEVWDKDSQVEYQYLRPDAMFNERTIKDKDDITIQYDKSLKPCLIEYKREWTSGFAKFIFCAEPKNEEVIYLPSYSNLSVMWNN